MEENKINAEEQNVTPTPRRGRPRKIELSEPVDTTIDDIVSVEEIKEDGKKEETNVVNSENNEKADVMVISNPEQVISIDNDDINSINAKINIRPNVYIAEYLYKKGETVYLVYFSGKHEESLYGNIEDRYKFRPLKAKIKEVVINSDNTISYKFYECQGCFLEKLVTRTEEECQRICDYKNAH